jgi:hypothetical protein
MRSFRRFRTSTSVSKAPQRADIATLGGDIQQLSGYTKTDIATLAGEIKRVEERFVGEIKRLQTLIKVLIGLAIIGMTLFSPNAAELIRLLK